MASPKVILGPHATGFLQRLSQTIRELLVLQAVVPAALLAAISYLVSLFKPKVTAFNPDTDIPSLSDRVILVTGGNTGIGKETILQLAKHKPGRIFLGARNKTKAENAVAEITAIVPDAHITVLKLDLTSFASIKEAATTFTAETSRLDLLILNAGIMATPLATTEDGFEAQFGTNHIGHALLTKLLLPTLLKTADMPHSDVRIISVSSIGHHMAPKDGLVLDHEKLMTLAPFQLYGQSKLANILYAKALAKRYPQIMSASVHPGLISTDLYFATIQSGWIMRLGMKMFAPLVFGDVSYGALNQLWAATSPRSGVVNGGYYNPVGKSAGASKYATDEELADRLWGWTEAQLE